MAGSDPPKVFLHPRDQNFGSYLPIYHIQTFPAVLSRIQDGIPPGAWLDGTPTWVCDVGNARVLLRLTDGTMVDYTERLFEERRLPADSILRVSSEELSSGRARTVLPLLGDPQYVQTLQKLTGVSAEVTTHSEVSQPQTSERGKVQTPDSVVAAESLAASPIFQAIDEMMQLLKVIRTEKSRKMQGLIR